MGNITKGSKTAPFLEPRKIEVYQFPVREERDVNMGRVPDDLIYPILNRFDQNRVHQSVAWDKRFNTVLGQHIHLWRPRVVVTFETDVVLSGRACSLALMLTVKVFIPRSRYQGPLDGAHFKKCMSEQEFIFHTGADAQNEEILEALQVSLHGILDNVAVRRMVFDVRNYPLPQQLQDTLAKALAYENACYATLGVKVNCLRIDGMTKFFSCLPAQFFELNAHMYTFEEKMIRYDHIVMNINFGDDPEVIKRFIVYRINEWRQGLRKIKVYRIAGLTAHLSEILTDRGWLMYICNCGREAVVYGKDGKYIRISHLGTNLIIHDSKMEYKPEKRHKGLPV